MTYAAQKNGVLYLNFQITRSIRIKHLALIYNYSGPVFCPHPVSLHRIKPTAFRCAVFTSESSCFAAGILVPFEKAAEIIIFPKTFYLYAHFLQDVVMWYILAYLSEHFNGNIFIRDCFLDFAYIVHINTHICESPCSFGRKHEVMARMNLNSVQSSMRGEFDRLTPADFMRYSDGINYMPTL